jgi:P27 family predicted phage terminase small subunit
MRGRRPKPTRLKVLTGNPGKRPLNMDEPRPDAAIPDCPPELGDVAKREWDRLVGELAALRILTNLDRAALAAYCNAYALWAGAIEAIQKYGTMVKSPNGYPVQSPYIAIANRQAEIMLRIASEFGFTPASRSRIATPSLAEPTLFDRLDPPRKSQRVEQRLTVGARAHPVARSPSHLHVSLLFLLRLRMQPSALHKQTAASKAEIRT